MIFPGCYLYHSISSPLNFAQKLIIFQEKKTLFIALSKKQESINIIILVSTSTKYVPSPEK